MTEQKGRPDVLMGKTVRIETGCGRKYVTLNVDDSGGEFEVFVIMGKSGGCANANSEAIARLLSWGLRSGASLEEAVKHLRGIQCNMPIHKGPSSCADAIGIALNGLMQEGDKSCSPT